MDSQANGGGETQSTSGTLETCASFGELVRDLRFARNMTQGQLAHAAEVGIVTIHRLESGAPGQMRRSTAVRLFTALNNARLLTPAEAAKFVDGVGFNLPDLGAMAAGETSPETGSISPDLVTVAVARQVMQRQLDIMSQQLTVLRAWALNVGTHVVQPGTCSVSAIRSDRSVGQCSDRPVDFPGDQSEIGGAA